ncbi:MAG: 4-hydroxy-tetrahydrodipicolinate synthase [Phycisphaerae bacterium]
MAKRKPTMQGAMTALVTPFRHGDVDWTRLDALVDLQIEAGIDWLVPCGTTGESPTLTHDEHGRVVEAVIERAAGRVAVMAGTGSNATTEAVHRTRHAKQAGADAALIVAPYYNRPSPEGLFRHFATIAERVDLPIVLYNVPARTGVSIPNDVVVQLREHYDHIVGIKHATGSVDGVTDLLARCDIAVLSGDDALTLPIMALGGVGLISVVANLYPAAVKALVDAGLRQDLAAARRVHAQVSRLAALLGSFGTNPIPIKTAMAIAGLIEEEFRLPLCPLDLEDRERLQQALEGAQAIAFV